MNQLKVIVVDDERLARVELNHLLSEHRNVIVLDSCSHVDEALQSIQKNKPDVIFLDINMPEKNGFDLVEEISEDIQVVFVTAYDQYALAAFEFNALDYLMKPLDPERLLKSITKCLENKEAFAFRLAQKEKSFLSEEISKLNNHIFIKDGAESIFLELKDVILFSSFGNYVKIFTKDQMILSHNSLNVLESRTDSKCFFRANRYSLINIDYIDKILPAVKSKIRCQLENGQIIDFSERKSVLFRKQFGI